MYQRLSLGDVGVYRDTATNCEKLGHIHQRGPFDAGEAFRFTPSGMGRGTYCHGVLTLSGRGWCLTEWPISTRLVAVYLKRSQLSKCLASLQADDVLIVWKLDRLGRSLRDLIPLLDDLKARRVALRSLTESIDTTTPTGRAMWQMVGILAELERSLMQERTKAGRAAAVARGVKMGRKPLLSAQQGNLARKLIEQGEHPNTVASFLNVSRSTMYRALRT